MKRTDVWVILAVVTALAVPTSCGGDEATADEPAPTAQSPSRTALEGHLLFWRFDESTHSFLSAHVTRTDGSDEVELRMPGEEGPGSWSRSGHEITALAQSPDGRLTTAIIDADGNVLRTLDLPAGSLNLVCSVWSRDDSRLACEGFDESDPGAGGVYTVRSTDGSDLVRLTKAPPGMADLPGDYSPDGSTFVFKRTIDEDEGALMTVPVGGGRATRLAPGVFGDAGRYSPDGAAVLTSSGGALVLLNAAGEETGRIAVDGHFLFGAVWSPDGTHIAYSDAVGGPYADVYVSLPDGSDKQRVTDTPDNEINVSWGAA
jgi:Tol biopolymer transport system component